MTPPAASSRRAFQAQRRAQGGNPSPSRAGRNLPAAIGVGVGLGALVIATLVIWKPAFLILVTAAIVLGAVEMIGALAQGRIHVPYVPTLLGTALIVPVAYYAGPEGLVLGFVLASIGILLWRAVDGLEGALKDVAGGVFVLTYLPVMAGIAMLMLAAEDGVGRILTFAIVTVVSDIGGYAVGVVAGRHPMAPSISPKKSWEGFAGSVSSCLVAGALTVPLLLDGPVWAGLLLGACVACFATMGDLSESTIKRDLGIKDMGNLLPGHGGVMDRLDSLLVTAPVCWLLLGVLVPVVTVHG